MIRVRIKRFPAIFLLANTISGPLFGTDVAVFLAWFGFFAGWTYLRFYKKTFPDLESGQSPSLKGDASETFAMYGSHPCWLDMSNLKQDLFLPRGHAQANRNCVGCCL